MAGDVEVSAAKHLCTSFEGEWILDKSRSQSPDPQLKALGLHYFWRRMATLATPNITIHIDAKEGRWHERIVVGGGFEASDTLNFYGRERKKSTHGLDHTEQTRVEENGACLVTHIDYTAGHHTEIRRYVVKEECKQTYKVHNTLTLVTGETLERTSYFVRKLQHSCSL